MTPPIRILIIEDHPLFREGVVNSLSRFKGLEIVGETDRGEQGLEMARELLPDIVLLDITLQGKDGLSTAGEIAIACPAAKIIMLTASEHEDDLMKAFKSGAKGYVVKGVSGSELARVIQSVVAGDVYVSPNLASELLSEMSRPSRPDPLDSLTEREREILELVAEGLTNREIGARLHLAEATIKHYMSNVLQKMQVRSRVQAALIAQKMSLDRGAKNN